MIDLKKSSRDILSELSIEAKRLVRAGYYNVDFDRKRAVRSLRSSILSRDNKAIIAEIKRASPSSGWLRKDLDIKSIIASIERGGAAGISILTMPRYFHGDLKFLSEASTITKLPLLMKDFIVSSNQIEAGWRSGADAILLILKIFKKRYSELSIEEAIRKIHSLGMEVLLEVHTREELLEASALDVDLIGVNSRNLETMNVETDNFIHSITNIDVNNKVLVAESGINSPEQISMLKKLGYKAFLIGTAIMNSNDIEQAVKSFVGDP